MQVLKKYEGNKQNFCDICADYDNIVEAVLIRTWAPLVGEPIMLCEFYIEKMHQEITYTKQKTDTITPGIHK